MIREGVRVLQSNSFRKSQDDVLRMIGGAEVLVNHTPRLRVDLRPPCCAAGVEALHEEWGNAGRRLAFGETRRTEDFTEAGSVD